LVAFDEGDLYAMACGGAVAVAISAEVVGSIVSAGAFAAGASATVIGDVDCVGAAGLGVGAVFTGDILTQAAVTLGAVALMQGDINCVGAGTFGASATYTGNVKSQAAITIGANSALPVGTVTFTGNVTAMGLVTVGASTYMKGNILGASGITVAAAASISGLTNAVVVEVIIDSSAQTTVFPLLLGRYNSLMALESADLEASISSVTNILLPGVYSFGAAWSFAAARTLNFVGNANDTWIIQISGAAVFGGTMVLNANVNSNNIVWYVYTFLKSLFFQFKFTAVCGFLTLMY
jgi:cytoskeletal protein CcmA (bactofilin family)